VVWRRGNAPTDDARMIIEWLLEGGLVAHYFPGGRQLQAMHTQLFVEVGFYGLDGVEAPDSRFAARAGVRCVES
jgi:hypothetical protein